MSTVGWALVKIGGVINLIGNVMILIKAFQKSTRWGLTSLFPHILFKFIAQNREETKKGLVFYLVGAAICAVGWIIWAVLHFTTDVPVA